MQQEDKDDVFDLKDSSSSDPLPEKDLIDKLRRLTAKDQAEEDLPLLEALRVFFENDFATAEHIFAKRKAQDPLASAAYSSLGFMKAAMSFQKDDLDAAMERLAAAEKLATAVIPKQSCLSFLRGRGPMSCSEFRANVIKAECNFLLACLLLLQESVVSYAKAGLALRRCYKHYEICRKAAETDSSTFDLNSLSGVNFGFGAMNCVLALLPPKLLSLIQFLGFPCDYDLGLASLHKSVDLGGLRSPIAALFLITLTGILPSFAPVTFKARLVEAEQVLSQEMEKYPRSCIHLWLGGRLRRSQRAAAEAKDLFQRCVAGQDQVVQMKHLALYELGWCHAFQLDWRPAADAFAVLAQENSWSKAFYTYAEAAFLDSSGDKTRATALYTAAPGFIARKFGGRVLSAEQFVIRKVESFQKSGFATVLPGLELVMLFNGFSQMSPTQLQAALDAVLEQLKLFPDPSDKAVPCEDLAVCQLMAGALFKELGRNAEALEKFAWIRANRRRIKGERYVVPHALYEHACLLVSEGKLRQAKALLVKARDRYSDYNFEIRLLFRIHLTLPHVSKLIEKGGETPAKPAASGSASDDAESDEEEETEEDEPAIFAM